MIFDKEELNEAFFVTKRHFCTNNSTPVYQRCKVDVIEQTSRSTERSIGRDGDGVDVASVTDVVGL